MRALIFTTAAEAEAYAVKLYEAAMAADDRGDEHVICAAQHYEGIALRLSAKEQDADLRRSRDADRDRELERKRASFNKLCRGHRLF